MSEPGSDLERFVGLCKRYGLSVAYVTIQYSSRAAGSLQVQVCDELGWLYVANGPNVESALEEAVRLMNHDIDARDAATEGA